MIRRPALVAAAVLAAATSVVLLAPSPPAAAAACSGATGVTVITDFNSLGGGVQGTCVGDGGNQYADDLFEQAGFGLDYASRQPGFVCRVAGAPASDPCVNTAPADAFWALWWSDGLTGRWTYSSLGVTSLRIPEGGYVAFSYDDVEGAATPSFAPAKHATSGPGPGQGPDPSGPPPDPSPSPSSGATTTAPGEPTPKPPEQEPPEQEPSEPGPGAPSSAVPTDASPTAAPSTTPSGDATGTPAPSPTATPTDAPTSSAAPGDDETVTELAEPTGPIEPSASESDDDGLPAFVAPTLIVLLFGGAAAGYYLRRRGPDDSPA